MEAMAGVAVAVNFTVARALAPYLSVAMAVMFRVPGVRKEAAVLMPVASGPSTSLIHVTRTPSVPPRASFTAASSTVVGPNPIGPELPSFGCRIWMDGGALLAGAESQWRIM